MVRQGEVIGSDSGRGEVLMGARISAYAVDLDLLDRILDTTPGELLVQYVDIAPEGHRAFNWGEYYALP